MNEYFNILIETTAYRHLTLDISDHFPVFLLMGKNKSVKGQPQTVEYRKLDCMATDRIKAMLLITDWSHLTQLDDANV